MTVTLYHSPLACSLASRLALAEAGVAHEIVLIRLMAGEQNTPEFRAINPRGKVPTLTTNDGILTESSAILPYIADLAPASGLMPPAGTYARAQAQSWLSYISSSVHAAYTGAFRPEYFTIDGASADAIRTAHIEKIGTALGLLETHLTDREFILDALSVCDLYLLVFLLWRQSPAVAGKLPDFPALDAFQARMSARPAIGAALAADMQAFAAK